ncbi:putative ribonuclease H-like domain-containing protein [Tanacetum coccineum]|uniref:Ribonuclease H-like domain-containing protein n=1 Tax=Tanacetum coccineum TaxID=301880 RepID=A0ABQ5GKC8_9ASTR
MFDIDYFTDSMNYIPVSLENQTNQPAGTSEVTNPNAGTSEVTSSVGTLQTPHANASEKEDEDVDLIIVPTAVQHTAAGTRKPSTNSKKEECLTELQNLKSQENEASPNGISEDAPDILAFRKELDAISQKHLGEALENNTTSTPSVNTGSGSVNTGTFDASQHADSDDSDMPELEIFNRPKQGIFDEASYNEEGMVHDFNNLPTEVAVSPIPTHRIHNIHPQRQILGDPKSSVQTRSRVKQTSGATEEPKKILEALKDDSWVEALQEKLLQFRLQQVWILVDLPHGAKVIGTKWVYRNKRDERGVVVRNKARLVAQAEDQPSSSEPLPSTSHPKPVAEPTPVPKPKTHPTSPSPEPDNEPTEHTFDQPSTEHQPLSPRQAPEAPKSQYPSHPHVTRGRSLTADDLLHMVPTLITKVDSLETELKQTKQTMGKAIVKLVKKVKKLENILQRRNVVITTSEDEELEDQGRIFKDIDDDPLVSFCVLLLNLHESSGRINLALQPGKQLNIGCQRLLPELKMLAEEEELTEQQKQRKAQVQFEAQHYTEEDWDAIRAKLEANAELAKSVIAKDMSEEDFAKRMVDLVNPKNRNTLQKKGQKQKEVKPMTQSH